VSLRARLNAGYAAGAWSASHNGDDEEVWLVLTTRQGMDGQLPSDEPALESWPLGSVLELGMDPREVQRARRHGRQLLHEHGLSCLSGDAEILISELVTNAIEASRPQADTSQVQLALLCDGTQLLIMVRDTSPEAPQPVQADAADDRGRGLLLVSQLCAQWGWSYLPTRTGKVVWAVTHSASDHSASEQAAP
jgi:anti-sigma regulatory factor (Ser/Thr protein kinase)